MRSEIKVSRTTIGHAAAEYNSTVRDSHPLKIQDPYRSTVDATNSSHILHTGCKLSMSHQL